MTTTWDYQEKPGLSDGGWQLNEANMELNQAVDPDSGNVVTLNGVGTLSSWSFQTKN